MRDRTGQIFFFTVCVIVFLATGCMNAPEGTATPSPTGTDTTMHTGPELTPVIHTTILTRATVPVPVTSSITAAATPAPTHTESEACPASSGMSPIPKPITLNGTGEALVYFDAAAPGNVTITASATKVEGCDDDLMGFRLVGKSTCNSIERSFSLGTTSVILPNSGKYSVTVRGCRKWKILIKNS